MHTLTVLPSVFIVGLGMWAAERRLLEEPSAYRPLFRRAAVAGLTATVLGAVPLALVYAGAVHLDAPTIALTSYLHKVSGMFGGVGYVALLALAGERLTRRASTTPSRVAYSLSALGTYSLSAYLFQSLAWQTLLPPYTASLASRFGSPLLTALTLAVVVWLLSVLCATWLRRRSITGPAERLLRRLAYGRVPARRTDVDRSGDDQRPAARTRTLSVRNLPAAEVPTETT